MKLGTAIRTAFVTSASIMALNTASASWAQAAEPQPAADNMTGQVTPVANDAGAATASAPDEGEAIVVTGFRESLTSAINIKRNETGIVDVIKAEDIAAFPDLNLAEALQRIPGVAISREAGEGRQISVRGL